MSGGPEHPERDPALERAWRAQSQELPPPELDRAILAAAHRAAGSAPQHARARATANADANRPQRWWMPLAAAATIGVVVIGILQVAPPDQDAMAPIVVVPPAPQPPQTGAADSRAARAGASAPGTSQELASPAREEKQSDTASSPKEIPAAPAASRAMAQKRQSEANDAAPEPEARLQRPLAAPPPLPLPAPAAPVPAPAPAPPAPPAPRMAAPPTAAALRKDSAAVSAPPGERESAVGSAAPAVTSSKTMAAPAARLAGAGPASGPGASAERTTPAAAMSSPEALRAKARDPQAWIERIRKLRDEGKVAEAQRELRDFRAAFADAETRLPPDLRDWMKP